MIDIDGFLSPAISTWVSKHRAEHATVFNLADRLSKLALRDLLAATPADDRVAITMVLLFARGVTTLQSALLLTERGLTADGRTLVRSLTETVIHFAAAKSDPAFVDRLIAQDKDHKTKVARRLIAFGSETSGLNLERVDRLSEYLEARKSDLGSPIDLSALAARHGLGGIYDTYYRGLSGDAAHPTVTSLNRHVQEDEDGNLAELRWGPDVPDVGDTILSACAIAFHLLWWAQEAFGSADNRNEFDACWEIYKAQTAAALLADP